MKKHDILEKAKKTYELLAADPAVLGQTRQAAALIEKLEKKDITVSIIGQFKRGKSSLSNKILEDEILPVGIVPITSAVTKVVYGKRAAEVHFFNGVVEEIPFDRLSEFISEQENSDNRLGVESVVLRTPSKFLKHGLTFVDTPGVGSFHKNNTETAYHYMKESDAVIFLLSVDSPINQIEIDFLQSAREFAGKFYFAVNKTDIVGEADLTAYMDYCGKLLCHMMQVEEIAMFPVSARTGDGIEALKKAILRDYKKSAEEILTQSAEKKLRDVINSALIQLDFYWKAMNMEYKELDERFAAVSNTVEEIKASAADIDCLFEIHLNEMKLELSQKVKELFGMEYRYVIEELPAGLVQMNKIDFLKQVDALCSDLEKTLSGILLYREENAYAVVRRINGINKLSRSLRKIRDDLTGCSV
ncbi:dynamin family protein [Ihubacter sp. mB4P-1]|uniref:dynamin family protein n=1 Tax=Ihubacter sp. mB4P-1 TaxID=3242370 RepID=UPI003C7B54D1